MAICMMAIARQATGGAKLGVTNVMAVASQSVTTMADVGASGLMRNTAGNSHARIDVIAVLPDTRHCVIKAAGLSMAALDLRDRERDRVMPSGFRRPERR